MEEEELSELVYENNHNHNSNSYEKRTNPKILLQTVLSNSINILEIDSFSKDVLLHKFEEYDGKSIIFIACITDCVMPTTLKSLIDIILDHFGSIDVVDKNWYYWEPIHYASQKANPEKLKIIERKTDINALTTFSENALHILLSYTQSVQPFMLQITNGIDIKMCTITPTEKKQIAECANILIQGGIDINHNNFWNETPILLAIQYRYTNIINMLLSRQNIDLDTCKDSLTGKSARELLIENDIIPSLLNIQNAFSENPVAILFTFLKSYNESEFVKYNSGNISEYVNIDERASPWNSCGTLLQYCFKRGYLSYESMVNKKSNQDVNKNILKTSMVNVFCKKGFLRCIEHLLNNGANPKMTTRKFQSPLLEASIKLNYYPFLTVLLAHKSSPYDASDILSVIQKLLNEEVLQSKTFYVRHVLILLLNKLEILQETHFNKNAELVYGHLNILNNFLILYLESGIEEEEDRIIVGLLLKLGASLTSSKNNVMVIEKLSYDVLQLHLNQCFDDSNNICYDSFIEDLDHKYSYSEMKAIHCLANDEKKNDLLLHPALLFLAHNKWLKLQHFFYLDFFFYSLFLLSLYSYVLCIQKQTANQFFKIIFVFFLIFHLSKECIQLYLYRLKYFKDISNYVEMSVIICSFMIVFLKNEISMVIAILCSTVNFLVMFGQFPKFTKYMIIFNSTKYFFEYSSFYFIQFVSFAICFFIIFPSENNVDDSNESSNLGGQLVQRMFESLILFTGEFNDELLHPKKFPVFGRILVTVFIFCMTIILNNLLVGLIVTDMDQMQKTAKLYKQIRMIKFVSRMEALLKRLSKLSKLKHFKIFTKGQRKFISLAGCTHNIFDEDDKNELKEIIKRNQTLKTKTLQELYDHMWSEIEGEHKAVKGRNRDILEKLLQLENKLNDLRAQHVL